MNANELRIGNCVNRLGEPTVVTSISRGGYLSTLASGSITQNQVEPIPITEEWLLKFGFQKDGGSMRGSDRIWWRYEPTNYDAEGHFYLWFSNESSYVEIHPLGGLEIDGVCVDARCVHQLQNIYFALTGQELEIK